MIRYLKIAMDKTKNTCIWSTFANIKEIVILNITQCLYNNIINLADFYIFIDNLKFRDKMCKSMYIKYGK